MSLRKTGHEDIYKIDSLKTMGLLYVTGKMVTEVSYCKIRIFELGKSL